MPSDTSRRALEKYWFGQSQPSTDGEVEFSIEKSWVTGEFYTKSPTMNESFRKERWSNFDLQPRKLLFLKSGWSIPHLEADEKDGRNHWGFCRKNMQQKCLVCICLQIAFWDLWWVHAIFQTSVCMWFKQGFFCHRLFGKHVWFFRTWLKEWRNCILELIKFPFQSQMIQLAGPSIMWNHMCMSMNLRNH